MTTIPRRQFLIAQFAIAMAVLPALASVAQAQEKVLQSAFDALDPAARVSAQSQLAMAGLYDGALDGRFGPGTQAALTNAAVYVADNSYGKVAFDLADRDAAAAFVQALSREELGKYLWGEGDEGAEG